jgi:hypothetical protein
MGNLAVKVNSWEPNWHNSVTTLKMNKKIKF